MIDGQKTKRIKPDLPGGFRDYAPADAIARRAMLDTIRATFESFGFDPLETPAVQKTDVLTGGEEDSGKIIFNVKGSQEKSADWQTGEALRFDLTVPLARFVAANPDVPKPFKRYEIGRVWRGERSQAGRYREFTQADVDIVGSSSLDADAEIAAVVYQCLRDLGVENFVIKYNNRKILDALPAFAGFPETKLWSALRIMDKCDKIGDAGVKKELTQVFGTTAAEKIRTFLETEAVGSEGAADYETIRDALAVLAPGAEAYFRPDLFLVRGLSYYTGSVFEATLDDAPEIGSVAGGGRYDDLVAAFTGQRIPAVGVSIGVDRLYAAMEKIGVRPGGGETTLAHAIILTLDPALRSEYRAMAAELRASKVSAALYLGDDTSFQAQLAYAAKKEIPYAVIYGAREREAGLVVVKNLAGREQKEMPRDQLAAFFKR